MAHQVVFFATASGTYAMAVAVPGGAAAAATLGRYADEFLGALSPAARALDDARSDSSRAGDDFAKRFRVCRTQCPEPTELACAWRSRVRCRHEERPRTGRRSAGDVEYHRSGLTHA